MIVTVNGEPREIAAETATVAGIVELLAGDTAARGVAVALDGEVVPRGAWRQTPLAEGARLEVVAAVQGG